MKNETNYFLQHIPREFWVSVKKKAAEKDLTVKEVIFRLLEDWLGQKRDVEPMKEARCHTLKQVIELTEKRFPG